MLLKAGCAVSTKQENIPDSTYYYLIVDSSQGVCQFLNRRRKPVVYFISRSPEGVASAVVLRKMSDLENGVVGGDLLESDTGNTISARVITLSKHAGC